MKELATVSKGAPISLEGLCADWFTRECNGQATKTGYCDACTAKWVYYFVTQQEVQLCFAALSAEWFLRNLPWLDPGVWSPITLQQAVELRNAIGLALGSDVELQRIFALHRAKRLWDRLPQTPSRAANVDRFWLALTWLMVVIALGAVCGLVFRWSHLQPHATMDFLFDAQPASPAASASDELPRFAKQVQI
jgi:hypothetical protein